MINYDIIYKNLLKLINFNQKKLVKNKVYKI